MTDIVGEEQLARIARDIMFSDEFEDLLDDVYSQGDRIDEFESDPKQFLVRHGFSIPGGIDVVIHDPGTIGRPARVDLHWPESIKSAPSEPESIKPAPSEMQSSMTQELRRLARIAWDILHSREMRQLRDVVQASPEALRSFTSNPREYAATHQVLIPNELEVIVHVDDSEEVRVDLHFMTSEPDVPPSGPDVPPSEPDDSKTPEPDVPPSEPDVRPTGPDVQLRSKGGCCYCSKGECCYYAGVT